MAGSDMMSNATARAQLGRVLAPCGKRVFGRRHLRVRCLTFIRGGPLAIGA